MFTPPRYAARYDWDTRPSIRGKRTQGWVIDIYKLVTLRQSMSPIEAWAEAKLPPATAKSALTTLPVRLTFGSAGIVPPDMARRMFARSVAKSIDANDEYPDLEVDRAITSFNTEERSFKLPRYMPRLDWQAKLKSLDPEEGSWQADLVRYWELRQSGKKEEDAWADVGMSIENAKLALRKEEPAPGNDLGLIPDRGSYPTCRTGSTRTWSPSVYSPDPWPRPSIPPTSTTV